MINKGVALRQGGDAAAEIETYDALIARFGDSTETTLLEQVAGAMIYKGVTLGEGGDAAAEIETYDQALGLLQNLSTQSAKEASADVAIRLGNLLFDYGIDARRSEALFLLATEDSPLFAYSNLCWLYISTEQIEKAKQVLGKLDKLPSMGRALIDAAMAIDIKNFGHATELLKAALSEDLERGEFDFTDDIERLIRVAIAKGFGDPLIDWFEESLFSERYAPIYVALLAAVRGEKLLLDSNPEVRHAANLIYSRLTIGKKPSKDKKL